MDRRLLYLIITFTSGGVFVSQIILSDIIGILFRYDFRFLNAALALFGFGIGGIIASLYFKIFNRSFSKSVLSCIYLFLYNASSNQLEKNSIEEFSKWAINYGNNLASFPFKRVNTTIVSLLTPTNKYSPKLRH